MIKNLKDVVLVFAWKNFQRRKAFDHSRMLVLLLFLTGLCHTLHLLFFHSLTFLFSLPSIYQENNFCCVYNFCSVNNSAKDFSFLTDFPVFCLGSLWLSFWSSEYCYFLTCYFVPKFLLTCNELHAISAEPQLSHLKCSCWVLGCWLVCANFIPLVWPMSCLVMRLLQSDWASLRVLF